MRTKEDIARMAREAGWWTLPRILRVRLERFATMVAAAEREACAKLCDTTPPYPFRPSIEAAHAIRQRAPRTPQPADAEGAGPTT